MGLKEISPRPTAGMILVRQAGPFSRESCTTSPAAAGATDKEGIDTTHWTPVYPQSALSSPSSMKSDSLHV